MCEDSRLARCCCSSSGQFQGGKSNKHAQGLIVRQVLSLHIVTI